MECYADTLELAQFLLDDVVDITIHGRRVITVKFFASISWNHTLKLAQFLDDFRTLYRG